MSAIDRRARGAALTRSQGSLVVLAAVGGFILGEVVGLVATEVAASLANYHGSLSALSLLSEPPWWVIVAGLIGVWTGFLAATAFAQRTQRVVEFAAAYRVQLRDVQYVLVGVGLQIVVSIAYEPFNHQQVSAPAHKLLGSETGWTFALVAGMTAVGAPIVEELFFRGVLLKGLIGVFSRLRGNRGVVCAVLADGVLFGLAHGELLQLAGLAAVGVVLSVLYLRTRRLVPCVITHASFNAVAVFALLAQRGH